jgi:hypothetical protein
LYVHAAAVRKRLPIQSGKSDAAGAFLRELEGQSPNIGGAVGQFVASQDAFDQWFKGQVKDTTGVDLNVPPTGPLSDVLSVYEA